VSKFDRWWDSDENPCRDLPESTRVQVKYFVRAAFDAGREAEKKPPKVKP
jgi:hypothetical protein